MREYHFYVYIMASDSGTLYIGMTNDLARRVYEHKNGLFEGFTKRYGCHKLIYFEYYNYINEAIDREKQLKRRRREKKQNLIKSLNPSWQDLNIE